MEISSPTSGTTSISIPLNISQINKNEKSIKSGTITPSITNEAVTVPRLDDLIIKTLAENYAGN
jgi:hypothetical protein